MPAPKAHIAQDLEKSDHIRLWDFGHFFKIFPEHMRDVTWLLYYK